MKNTKKAITIILSLMLLLSFSMAAFAVTEEYKAYKIFSGNQSDGYVDLYNVNWGDGINAGDFLTALMNDTTFGDTFDECETAADVAKILADWEDGSDEAKLFAKIAYANIAGEGTAVENGETSLDAGYYLVVDTTATEGQDAVKNLALLQQTKKGTFEIAVKVDKPTVQKKVKDINDTQGTTYTDWQDSADYDIGDTIPFQLKADLKTIAPYDKYELVFVDTGCAGLTVDAASFKLYIDENEVTAANAFTADVEGNDFTVTIPDVKALGAADNSVVTVEYEAVLTENAEIGLPGNPNEVYLKYSNNANFTGPYIGEDENETPESELGATAPDKVIVFTYQVEANKINEDDQHLTGAGFTLYKKNAAGEYEAIGEEIKGDELTTFTWVGIDDGDYKLAETTVPNGYARMEDLEFTVSAAHEAEADDPQLIALAGGDAFTGSVDTGALVGDIKNIPQGTILPETGGIGTKIFYIAGSIMLAGAAILLITKKRMNAEKA
ncbi:MAG: isopeptide-forming domain-containing fimbrial protein [Clostridia bacterium]|nr:isopeptide-forming domain-containing fimbrial protein [Clostridia bacterium]